MHLTKSELARLAELPDDPTVDALDAAVRAAVARVWAERAASELNAAHTFAWIAQYLIGHEATPEVQWLASRAVSDEVRHAAIAHEVATRYAGEDLAWPSPRAVTLPWPDGLPEHLDGVLRVVSTCCFGETLSASFLQYAFTRAEGPLVRAALHVLLQDEIDHARIGWGVLAALPANDRAELDAPLRHLLDLNVQVRRERARQLERDDLAAHGCIPLTDTERLLDECVRDVISPGLAHVGV